MSLQLNWGRTEPLPFPEVRALNKPEAVALATNKLDTFATLLEGGRVSIPPFWTNADEVTRRREDTIILARAQLRASGGAGIVVSRPGQPLPTAPLYVEYIRKQAEYRVHVGGGDVLAVQQKRRRNEQQLTADQQLIRNYDNGWVFAIENVAFSSDAVRQEVENQAIDAVAALGLDFGAVDIIVSRTGGDVYVLEVNTAPGIQSPTILEKYVEYFRREHDA